MDHELTRDLLTASMLLMMFTIAVGCNDASDDEGVAAQSVVSVADDDPEIVAAIESAKETLPFFEENWKTMESDGCSLKFALPTSDGVLEHIWFSPTEIQGDRITGECANEPGKIPGLNVGDVRTVNREVVSDWMILVGKKCYGGYTIRVLAQRDPDVAPPLEFIDLPAN